MTQINLAENLTAVQKKILECATSSGRDVNDIRLIAVSKTRSLEDVKMVAQLCANTFHIKVRRTLPTGFIIYFIAMKSVHKVDKTH